MVSTQRSRAVSPQTIQQDSPTARSATEGASETSLPLLVVDGLGISFASESGLTVAADSVSFALFPRQTVALVGESGSGKSVSALSILKLLPTPPGHYDGGRILWNPDGVDLSADAPTWTHRDGTKIDRQDLLHLHEKQMRNVRGNQISMIFQEPMTSLNPVYTVGWQIREAVRLHQHLGRNKANEVAKQALHDVGIADPAARLKEYPHQLSGGMRQRVMIAMALACQPRLLLADEPTTALDVTIQAQILELLRLIQYQRGMAILLITHDLGVVAENADVVAVMYAGRICEYGSVHEIFERPLHPYTRGLMQSMPVLGREQSRLPTVADGATIPEDFPAGFQLAPHRTHPDPSVGYGGANARLHEVMDNHWVLCTAEDGREPPGPPMLNYRR